ncbi:hypothetical protein FNV43_RR06352 [Rhamnella rubrinervis]|uniref:Uncharacterized protein n=1 Tax=Rhamnella rubrinervis TaxID=2594499 RepID=A0A8K0HCT1_9ROSA|nr:hypothetical protein FNV43_RR06352 [Rhamnella rubrinervis]
MRIHEVRWPRPMNWTQGRDNSHSALHGERGHAMEDAAHLGGNRRSKRGYPKVEEPNKWGWLGKRGSPRKNTPLEQTTKWRFGINRREDRPSHMKCSEMMDGFTPKEGVLYPRCSLSWKRDEADRTMVAGKGIMGIGQSKERAPVG